MTAVPVLFERKDPAIQYIPVDRVEAWHVAEGVLKVEVGQHVGTVLFYDPSHPQKLDKMRFDDPGEAMVDVQALYLNPLIHLPTVAEVEPES